MNLGSNSGRGGTGGPWTCHFLFLSLSLPWLGLAPGGAQHPAPIKADKLVAECSYLGGVAMSSLLAV